MKKPTVLVLGATGGIGGEVARKFVARGWNVRAMARTPPAGSAQWTWIKGDAMNADDVRRAALADGAPADVIVHAVNPPGYQNWPLVVLPMLENTIQAAKASGARVLLPGTIYNFGAEAGATLTEETPQRPTSRKGEIRRQMELRLEQASREGTPVLIVRAGDFFGPQTGSSWFAQGLVKPNKRITSIMNPSPTHQGHAWAYLPDLAETMVRLLEKREQLGTFATFNFGGHWDGDGQQMIGAIRESARGPVTVRNFPWWILPLVSPFSALFREMKEMRYLWQKPFRLDNQRLIAFLGEEPHTPLKLAVETTLKGLKCLPD